MFTCWKKKTKHVIFKIKLFTFHLIEEIALKSIASWRHCFYCRDILNSSFLSKQNSLSEALNREREISALCASIFVPWYMYTLLIYSLVNHTTPNSHYSFQNTFQPIYIHKMVKYANIHSKTYSKLTQCISTWLRILRIN